MPQSGRWKRTAEGIVLFEHDASGEDEEIFGADTRKRVNATDKSPYRFVCGLDLYFGGQLNKGTGFLISPRHVLTAGHNLMTGAGLRADKIEVFPGLDGANILGKRKAPAGSQVVPPKGYWIAPAYAATQAAEWDFALLTLPKEFPPQHGMTYGYWGDTRYAPHTRIQAVVAANLVGRGVSVLGYPADKCNDEKCADCHPTKATAYDAARKKNSWASTQWESSGAVSSAAASGLILYDADTCKGMSGGPVWMEGTNGERLLVAVHTGSDKPASPTANKGVTLSSTCLDLIRQRLRADGITPKF